MELNRFFFKYRSYTPIPLIVVVLILAKPSWTSFMAGFVLVLLGEGLRFWGVAYAGSATRTTGRAGGERLITDGPFGYVRNPLYLGNFLMSSGFLIMSWAWMPWMAFIFVLLFGIQYSFIIHHEEEYLSKKFGKEYANYKRCIRRWIPCFRKCPYREKSVPHFMKALKSERNTLQAIAAVTVLLFVRWYFL